MYGFYTHGAESLICQQIAAWSRQVQEFIEELGRREEPPAELEGWRTRFATLESEANALLDPWQWGGLGAGAAARLLEQAHGAAADFARAVRQAGWGAKAGGDAPAAADGAVAGGEAQSAAEGVMAGGEAQSTADGAVAGGEAQSAADGAVAGGEAQAAADGAMAGGEAQSAAGGAMAGGEAQSAADGAVAGGEAQSAADGAVAGGEAQAAADGALAGGDAPAVAEAAQAGVAVPLLRRDRPHPTRPEAIRPVPIGEHRLPPLPYPYNALEPHIDEVTMRLHHTKHHQSYVDGLNKAERQMAGARRTGNFELIRHWEREAAFHGAGHYLHTIFWNIMSPKGGGAPSGLLLQQMTQDFGGWDGFKQHFSQAAEKVEGVGWAIWVWSPRANRTEILQAEKHQLLSQWDAIPLLPLDVWEHAHYLKYPNNRKAYIEAWWNVVNWPEVARRLEKARTLTWEPF